MPACRSRHDDRDNEGIEDGCPTLITPWIKKSASLKMSLRLLDNPVQVTNLITYIKHCFCRYLDYVSILNSTAAVPISP